MKTQFTPPRCYVGLLLLFTCMTSLSAFAQAYRFSVLITDDRGVPRIDGKNSADGLNLIFPDEGVQQIFEQGNYQVYQFERTYPTARTPILQRYYLIALDDLDFITQLQQYDLELYPEADQEEELQLTSYIPNDYANLNISPFINSHLELIKAKEAWAITTGSPSVVIGISDTRIDQNHEDLKDKIVGIRGSNSLSFTHPNGSHGSVVSGAAAAHTDNNKGLSSVGFNCGILFTSIWGTAALPFTTTPTSELLILSQMGAKVISRPLKTA